MLVQYSLKSFRSGQLIRNLVIEIPSILKEKTSYRISNTGRPIYEADGFEIVPGNLDGLLSGRRR